MSRRPANFVQADVARALRAAQQAGPGWRVEIEGGVIRLIQAETPSPSSAKLPPGKEADPEPEANWKF